MSDPRTLIEHLEGNSQLPPGNEERFSGYGVMGLTFKSGHVLGLRRFAASSVGPGYISVWHRDSDGEWRMYQNVDGGQACSRYFGSMVAETQFRNIELTWQGPAEFTVRVLDGPRLEWTVSLASVPVTQTLNAIASLIPGFLWKQPAFLKVMATVAGISLRAGRVRMYGRSPNGQLFVANPRMLWIITGSQASIDGQDLGGIGPLVVQARLGEFLIPQRGLFVIGQAFFENFDPARHSSQTSAAMKS